MTPALLIREDTGDQLVLDGVLRVERRHDGTLTRHALPDATYTTDGLTILPGAISIEALVSQSPAIEGLLTGPERIAEVMEWLRDARREVAIVALQQPGRAQDTDLVIERYTDQSDSRDAPALSITLGEVRIAETSTLELAERTRPASPPVPSEDALDGEPEADGGRRGGKSLAAAALDALFGGAE